ncbi:MAG: carboxypeptidase-like regulatory protein [Mucilaginibacter sp.]|nr:carboxypeptidase-like regulatory protein [Mucilaginibacter sp.]
MKFTLLSILFFVSIIPVFAQQLSISGKITDDNNNPVPFASIYIKNTTKGTSANSEGVYKLQLNAGNYELQYKAVGYTQQSKQVELNGNQEINIALKTETYQLKTVAIHAGSEDPAYAIIRKAIKKRKTYLNEVNAYTCDIYIKGLQKLLAAPKKFLGFDVQKATNEAGLDSNRTGIVYLSESESKYSFIKPNKVHEVQVSSKVSGSNRAFSFNRASDMAVNFYENFETWDGLSNRPLVSPIADNALFYYNYKWMGISIENGETINKILVSPKRAHDPCFEGYIYILDDSWRLSALQLYITKKANINLVDTLKVNQQFYPVNSTAWMPATVKFEFTGGLLGFKIGGYYISIYKNYDLNPSFEKVNFAEVLRIDKGVSKDSAYWNQERPIPLTDEEKTDYKNKEKLAIKRESKVYLDSLDKANNKAKLSDILLTGVNTRNRYKKESFHYDGLLGSALYNTVEGFALDYGVTYSKVIDTVNNRSLVLKGKVRYGFSNHLFNGTVGAAIPLKQFTLGISGGSDIVDLNNQQPVSTLVNSIYTLFERQNYQKLYQKQFAAASLSGRITGGWKMSAAIEWANRKSLSNTTDYSFFSPKNHEFTSNNPLNPTQNVPLFAENQSFKVVLRTSYDFSNQYETYPSGRRYLPSKYPTIGLNYTKGIKDIFGSDVDYDLLSADISKSNIDMGFYGKTSFFAGAGKFLNANKLFYPDFKHFDGNQLLAYTPGINRFLLLDYYNFSTPDKYAEAHLEHNFMGFITNKIPLIRSLKLQEIVDVNYLYTPTLKNYTELGFGLQYLNIRAMYGVSYNSGSNVHSAFRIGVSL